MKPRKKKIQYVKKSILEPYKEGEACNKCHAGFDERCRRPNGVYTRLPHLERRNKP